MNGRAREREEKRIVDTNRNKRVTIILVDLGVEIDKKTTSVIYESVAVRVLRRFTQSLYHERKYTAQRQNRHTNTEQNKDHA